MNASGDTQAGTKHEGFAGPFVYLSEGMAPLKPRQVGLVPGTLAPLLPVDLPGALRGYAREQVAGRQLRDGLGGDQLDIRPFHSPGQAQNWARALIAARDQVEKWRAMCGPGGRALLPDYLALPAAPGIWTIASGPANSVVARLGPEDGFSAAVPVARVQLSMALDRADPLPDALYAPGPIPAEIAAVFSGRGIPIATGEADLSALKLEVPQALAHGELGFDLRRDPQAARARLAGRVLPWRWPVLAGLVAAGLWAGAQMLAINDLQDQTAVQRAATLETVRTHFVPEGPILDIRTQVNRSLAEARVASTGAGEAVPPLDLLGLAAEVIAEHDARPELLDYSAVDGLTASIIVDNFAAAEQLAEALRAAGLEVRVVESRARDGDEGVRTELRISAEARDE